MSTGGQVWRLMFPDVELNLVDWHQLLKSVLQLDYYIQTLKKGNLLLESVIVQVCRDVKERLSVRFSWLLPC